MITSRGVIAVVVMVSLAAATAHAQNLRIAAAADLQVALPEIGKRFEAATKIHAEPVYGSSGLLATQIRSGAPFDVYMSADVEYARQLANDGYADRAAVVSYAVGRVVLWTRNDSGVDVKGLLKGLAAPSIKRVAIGNPEHAPYGRAAAAALRHQGVYDGLVPRLVFGENISQTTQFALSGNADVAITALALTVNSSLRVAGRYAVIPAEWHPPIVQGAVWLKNARNQNAARQFVDFLMRPETSAYLQTMGFEPIR